MVQRQHHDDSSRPSPKRRFGGGGLVTAPDVQLLTDGRVICPVGDSFYVWQRCPVRGWWCDVTAREEIAESDLVHARHPDIPF